MQNSCRWLCNACYDIRSILSTISFFPHDNVNPYSTYLYCNAKSVQPWTMDFKSVFMDVALLAKKFSKFQFLMVET